MAEPEQIYEEVLQEEQQKGSSSAVAEGRAKAARMRAEQGSPHPKEPKWWAGAQPHLDGASGEAADEEGPPAEAPTEEQPAAQAPEDKPAAQAPAEAKPAAEAAKEQPAAQAPAEKPAVEAPRQQPAAAAQATPGGTQAVAERPLRVTELPPEQRPVGVRHGTTSGTRMRPEDGVVSDAQLTGEAALRERRRVIDELLATGVPAATAAEAGSPKGSPLLALMYIIVPLAAVLVLFGAFGNKEASAPADEEGGGGGGSQTVSAEGIQFDTTEITLTAGEKTSLEFVNNDTQDHNIAIYKSESDASGEALFDGKIINDASTTYDIPKFDKGEYYFQCDVHPSMKGTVVVE